MDWTLEVVVPVNDVDRAIAFYRDQVGFHLDHDTQAGDQRIAQLIPH
jgi:catechol 2,3-dioxygenase-like lactoylglutathione lyase family enzyme